MAKDKLGQSTLFGHPTGLYLLFFAEMWERFSYYGMRALLVFYMTKGFIGYNDDDAYAVYGSYTSLVYMTPFFGGMLADHLIGSRRAVILGGLFMAAGHLLMTWENTWGFFTALALLIIGNGFFKPNISTIVGTLYPEHSPKRDGGFTIFYMGINLGASMSPLLCGYIGETYGWHYGFGLATIGMLTGLAIFVAPTLVAQLLIQATAIATAVSLFLLHPDSIYVIGIHIFVGVSLLLAGIVSWMALARGSLPEEAGAPPDITRLKNPLLGIPAEWAVYLGTFVFIPIFALLVSGFAPLRSDKKPIALISDEVIERLEKNAPIAAEILKEGSRPAGLILLIAGAIAFSYLAIQAARLDRIARQRMYVVFILTFFSMLFWAFFEQAGSSLNNFTDRNVDRVITNRVVTQADVGTIIKLQPTQEQFGYMYQPPPTEGKPAAKQRPFTVTDLTKLRDQHKERDFTIDWRIDAQHVGMQIAESSDEIPASSFQSVNAIFILLFGLVFSALWTKLGSWNLEPSTPFKFALGLLQLGLGFAVFWYGAKISDERGMVAIEWLILGYLLHTTGELCLSPVGLAMVTRLSPTHLVSTVMGVWFLATAFSQYLAAIIAQFTSVKGTGDSGDTVPIPRDTVDIYGSVFGKIAIAAVVSSVICFALVPLLKRWMHEDVDQTPAKSGH